MKVDRGETPHGAAPVPLNERARNANLRAAHFADEIVSTLSWDFTGRSGRRFANGPTRNRSLRAERGATLPADNLRSPNPAEPTLRSEWTSGFWLLRLDSNQQPSG